MTRFWTTFAPGSSRDGSRRPTSAGCSRVPTAPPARTWPASFAPPARSCSCFGLALVFGVGYDGYSAARQAGRAVRLPGAGAGGGDRASPARAPAVGGRARRDGRIRRARSGLPDGRSRGGCRLGLRPGRKRGRDRGGHRDARCRAPRPAHVVGALGLARRVHGVRLRPGRLPRRRHRAVAPGRAVRGRPRPSVSRSPAETARPPPTRFAPPPCSRCSRASFGIGDAGFGVVRPLARRPHGSPSQGRSWPPPRSTCRG